MTFDDVALALNLTLWVMLVLGALVYFALALYERGVPHQTRERRHVILSRGVYLMLAVGGAGVLVSFLPVEGRSTVSVVLVGVRAVAIAGTWTLVLVDVQHVLNRRRKG